MEIWRINADGTGKQRLVHHQILEKDRGARHIDSAAYLDLFSLDLSPDKKTLAYSIGYQRRGNFAAGQPALWLVNADGTQQHRVFYLSDDPIETIGKELGNARWSPDGQRLIFYLSNYRLGWGGGEIYILNVNDGTVECTEQVGREIAWLPDNRRISYIRGELQKKDLSYRYEFCILDLDHRPWEPDCSSFESSGKVAGQGYDWSPDGQRLAIVREEEGIYVRDVASAAEPRLLVKEADVFRWGVEWSPDGRMIAYTTWPYRKPFTLNVVDAQDGRKLVQVEGVWFDTWSSDSQAIIGSGAYADESTARAAEGIHIVFVPGGQVWRVPNVEQIVAPIW